MSQNKEWIGDNTVVEIDKAAEFRKLKKQHDGEEDPIIIAQRFLNIFRQLHIFSAEKKKSFDQMLMELPPYIRGLFGSLPGGGLLQEYVDDLAEKEGVEIGSHTLAEASMPTGMEFEVAKAKILATALAEAQAQNSPTIAPTVVSADGTPATVIQAAPSKIELGSNFAQELGKILSQTMKESNQAAKDEIRSMVTTLGETQLEVVKVLHSDTNERRQESERLAVMLTQAQGQIAEMLTHPEEFGAGSETGKLIKMLADSQAQIAETLETIKNNGGSNTDSAKLFELSQQQFIKAVDAINENGRQNSKAIAEAISESQQELAKLIIQQNNQRMAASAQVEGDDIKINAADYLSQLNMIADKFSSAQGNNGKNIEKTVESLVKAQLDVYREVASRQAQELSSVISAALKESQEISNKNLIKALENLPKTTIIEKTVPQPIFTAPFFSTPTAPAQEKESIKPPLNAEKESAQPQTKEEKVSAPLPVEKPVDETPSPVTSAEEELPVIPANELPVVETEPEIEPEAELQPVSEPEVFGESFEEAADFQEINREIPEENLEEAVVLDEAFSTDNLFDETPADEALDELFNIGEAPDLTSEEINKPKKKKKKKKNKNKNQAPAETDFVEITAAEGELSSDNLSAALDFDLPQDDTTEALTDAAPQEDFSETNFEEFNQSEGFELSTEDNLDDFSFDLPEEEVTIAQDGGEPITQEWGESISDTMDSPAVMADETAPGDGEWEWEYEEVPEDENSFQEEVLAQGEPEEQDWEWEYEEQPVEEPTAEEGDWEWEYEELPEEEAVGEEIAADGEVVSETPTADGEEWEWEYEELPEDETDEAYAASNQNDILADDKPAGNW